MQVTLKCPNCGVLFTADVNIKINGSVGGLSTAASLKVIVKSNSPDDGSTEVLFVKHIEPKEILVETETDSDNSLTLSLSALQNNKISDIFTLECTNNHFNDYPIDVEP